MWFIVINESVTFSQADEPVEVPGFDIEEWITSIFEAAIEESDVAQTGSRPIRTMPSTAEVRICHFILHYN